jgi:hypothetical protein
MAAATADDGFVLVVSLRKLDATTTLFFAHAARLAPQALRLVEFGESGLATLLSRASAVIFVRGLFEFGGLPAYAKALGIPTYYFIDDNFMVLRQQGGPNARYVGSYSIENVRAALRGFAGVLVASRPLMEYFSAQQLHARLILYPPVMMERLPPSGARRDIRIAFFGGEHLREPFAGMVLPAIRRLAREKPLTLVAVGLAAPIEHSEGLNILQHPYDESYSRGIATLHRDGVDVFVHLVDAALANSSYKNPHALISACGLDAVPAVSDQAPYDHYCAAHDAHCSSDSEASWFASLSALVHDEALRVTLRAGVKEYCAANFGGATNRAVVDDMLARHHRPGAAAKVSRRVRLSGFVFAQLVQRTWRRFASGAMASREAA